MGDIVMTIAPSATLRFFKPMPAVLAGALLLIASPQAKAQWPDIIEAKNIAEEGFIYGLPIVMNYAVMYEYSVDKNSGQFKAPFNQIKNEARVFTYKDTSIVTPNSDTPYSFLWMDLRAEPMVLSVPAVEKDRYYAVQLEDGNTYNYGYIGSRATGTEPGDYMVLVPIGTTRPRQASRRCSDPPPSSRWRAIARSCSTPTTCAMSRRSRRVTRRSHCPRI
jgi:hypothetical protein